MASELSLSMRGDGYVRVQDVLMLNMKTFADIPLRAHTIDDIREAVRRDNKQRFSLLEENCELLIQANQGHSITISGELSAASPDRLSMASPEHGGLGKRIHNLPYSIDVNQSPNITVVDAVKEFGSAGLGNVAWKERVDGWKMKQEKNVIPMTTSHAASERGGVDIDASTDILANDSLLPYSKDEKLILPNAEKYRGGWIGASAIGRGANLEDESEML